MKNDFNNNIEELLSNIILPSDYSIIKETAARIGGLASQRSGKINHKKWQESGKVQGGKSAGGIKKQNREKVWLNILNDLPKEFTSLELKDICYNHGVKGSTFKLFKRKCKSIQLVKQGLNQFDPSIYIKSDNIDLSYGDYTDFKKRK